MPKPALVIDMLSGPKDGEEDDEAPSDDESASSEDPDAIIRDIEAKLMKLRGAI